MNKGPLIIVIMGIGAMVFFGFLANWLVENNPIIKEMTTYRLTVEKGYPVTRAVLTHVGMDYQLQLWIDPDDLGAPLASASKLPAPLASLPRHFFVGFGSQNRAEKLEIVLFKAVSSWGCQGEDQELCRVSFNLRSELLSLKREVANLMRATVTTIEPQEGDKLVVLAYTRPNPETAQKAAARVATFLGGGWREVEIRVGEESIRFDGSGKPLSR